MKAIIKFNLPEDQREYDQFSKAGKMASVLWDLDQFLRSKIKHAELTEEQYEAYDKTRSELCNLMEQEGFTMDDIMW